MNRLSTRKRDDVPCDLDSSALLDGNSKSVRRAARSRGVKLDDVIADDYVFRSSGRAIYLDAIPITAFDAVLRDDDVVH